MNETLWDAERSLYIDGVNVRGDEYEYERGEFTYNREPPWAPLSLAASGVPCEVDPQNAPSASSSASSST